MGSIDKAAADSAFVALVDQIVAESDEALVARLREIERQRRALDAEMAAVTACIDERGRFPDGHLSTRGFLRANLNHSGPTAGITRRVARLVNRFPTIGDTWLSDSLGHDQVVLLAKTWHNRRVRHRFDEFVDMLVDAAVRFEYDEFALVVQRFMLGADPDGSHDDRDRAVEHRDARVGVNGGELDATVRGGDALTAAEVAAIFETFVEAEYQVDLAARRAEHGEQAQLFDLPRTA